MKIIYWLLTLVSMRGFEEWLVLLERSGVPTWLTMVLIVLTVPNIALIFSPSFLHVDLPQQLWFGLLFATWGLFLVQGVYWLMGKVKKIVTKGKSLPQIKDRWWWLLWILGVILASASASMNRWLWRNYYSYEADIWLFIASALLGVIVFFYLLLGIKKWLKWRLRKKWLKFTKTKRRKYSLAWRVTLGIFWGWMSISSLITLNWVLLHDSPMMSTYAVLNAALKNTCFMDPAKENCPQELAELSYIEPKEYQTNIAEANVQAHYHYDAASGFYTFIIRYRPEKAIIFDWRLVDEHGVDFREVKVDLWSNKIKKQEATLDWVPDEILVFPEWEWYSFK